MYRPIMGAVITAQGLIAAGITGAEDKAAMDEQAGAIAAAEKAAVIMMAGARVMMTATPEQMSMTMAMLLSIVRAVRAAAPEEAMMMEHLRRTFHQMDRSHRRWSIAARQEVLAVRIAAGEEARAVFRRKKPLRPSVGLRRVLAPRRKNQNLRSADLRQNGQVKLYLDQAGQA